MQKDDISKDDMSTSDHYSSQCVLSTKNDILTTAFVQSLAGSYTPGHKQVNFGCMLVYYLDNELYILCVAGKAYKITSLLDFGILLNPVLASEFLLRSLNCVFQFPVQHFLVDEAFFTSQVLTPSNSLWS